MRVAHAPGMPGAFPHHRLQRKQPVSDPGMHHGTCDTHVLWCMLGSLTRGGFRHSRRMRSPWLYVSGKRPMSLPLFSAANGRRRSAEHKPWRRNRPTWESASHSTMLMTCSSTSLVSQWRKQEKSNFLYTDPYVIDVMMLSLAAYAITTTTTSDNQISWTFVCPWLLSQLFNRFNFLHRARQ